MLTGTRRFIFRIFSAVAALSLVRLIVGLPAFETWTLITLIGSICVSGVVLADSRRSSSATCNDETTK